MYPFNSAQTRTVYTDRLRIVWMWLRGMSAREISLETGASLCTVYRWVRRWQEEGNVETRPYRGRPRASSSSSSSSPAAVASQTTSTAATVRTPTLPHYTSYNSYMTALSRCNRDYLLYNLGVMYHQGSVYDQQRYYHPTLLYDGGKNGVDLICDTIWT